MVNEQYERVNVRLYKSDVEEIKRQAKKEGIAWHTKLRFVLRAAIRSTKKETLL